MLSTKYQLVRNRNSGNRNSADYNLGNRNSGHYNSGNCNTGNRNSGNYNSADYNLGNRNSGNRNSGNYNSADYNLGNRNSGHYNSGNCNTGWSNLGCNNSGDHNSGWSNSGDYNSGDHNSGYFNSDTPKVRIFNKDSDLDFDDEIFLKLKKLISSNLKTVCTWIYEEDMTEEEKENNPTYKTTGGYLKEQDYKYCWSKFWKKITQEEKDFIKSLPNFDADIFEEITGINVEKKTQEKKQSITLELTQSEIEKLKEILK